MSAAVSRRIGPEPGCPQPVGARERVTQDGALGHREPEVRVEDADGAVREVLGQRPVAPFRLLDPSALFLPLGDVADDTDAFRLAVLGWYRRERSLGGDLVAVGGLDSGLHRRVRLLGLGRRPHHLGLVDGLLVDDERGVGADEFRTVVAGHLGVGLVDHREVTVRVFDVDAVVYRLDDGLVLRQFPLVVLPFGDVL